MQNVYKSSFFNGLNELNINPGYKQLFISFSILLFPSDKGIKVHKHIIFRVINNQRFSDSCLRWTIFERS